LAEVQQTARLPVISRRSAGKGGPPLAHEEQAVSTTDRSKTINGASSKDRQRADKDVIVDNYRAILTELSLLTTVSVLLFGFLLAVVAREEISTFESWLLVIALICVASATMVFIMPVAYHRAQFPYQDWEKFQLRVHGFVTTGLPLFFAGFYVSVVLAVWERFEYASFIVAAVPLAVGGVLFLARRELT
jgi:Family of unknown function (DUF6328)